MGAPAITPSDAAVELRDVTHFYPGSIRALDGVSLQVAHGERCCLLGPNGAGKTTVVRLLQGALSPTSGYVAVFGIDATSPGIVEAKRRLGVVPQNPGLYRDLTVSEYLSLVQRLYGRGSPEGTIEAYGLADYRHRPLATLSGGYARRLLVAAAVLSEPELLLLDEPTVGLDPLAADDVRGLIGAAAEGRTVLMSTHNMYEAEALCDSVIILRDGRVLVHERIERLRRQTRPRVYIAATGPVERLGLALGDLRIPWEREAGTVEEPGVWADIADPEASMPDLLRALLSSGVDVYECRLVPPTLHDLFVRAVRDE